MNKKGFTLIELISVIAILGFIAILVFPKFKGMVSDKKQKLYDANVKQIEDAAKMFAVKSVKNFDVYQMIEDTGYAEISLSMLCDMELLNCPINNPITNNEMDGYVEVYKEGNSFAYNYVEYPELTYFVRKAPGASYEFVLNEDGYYESNNKGVHNSAAVSEVTVNVPTDDSILVLSLINSGEGGCDFGIVSYPGDTLSTSNEVDYEYYWMGDYDYSMDEQELTFCGIPAGTYTFYIKYRKDDSENYYNDSLQFKLRLSNDESMCYRVK